MNIEIEDACEKRCISEDSLEIDFDYEFEVAKFYDFSRVETDEEIQQSEQWFLCSRGYPPSPLVDKLNWKADDLEDSQACSSEYGHQNTYSTSSYSGSSGVSEVSSSNHGKKDQRSLKPKAKSSAQTCLSSGSRLLKPTASQLAKQNQQISVQSTRTSIRTPIRSQKYGSGLSKFPGEDIASKRQKLEIGYLRKVAHLKHPIHFSHKLPKKVGANEVNSHRKPKAITPKATSLETAHRGQRNRSENATNAANNLKSNRSSSSTNASLQEKSNPIFKFKARLSDKKSVSNKDNVGVSRISKCGTTTPKEFKLSSNKKLSQSPPAEIFRKLSLNSKNNSSTSDEENQSSQVKKGLKKKIVSCSIMKENKNSNAVTANSRTYCSKESQFRRGRIDAYVGSHPTNIRSIPIQSS